MVSSSISRGGFSPAPLGRHSHGKPDAAKMAAAMFSAIDTKGQGFIEKSDLASALQGVTSQSGSSTPALSADDAFKQLDTNGDGKITQQEFADDLKAMLANLQSQMQAGGTAPPAHGTRPPDSQGLSKDDLSGLSRSATDPSRKSQLDALIGNFSVIDANGDQQISAKEVLAYKQAQRAAQKTDAAAPAAQSKADEADAKLLRRIMQIARSYGVAATPPVSATPSSSSVSATA